MRALLFIPAGAALLALMLILAGVLIGKMLFYREPAEPFTGDQGFDDDGRAQ